MSAATDRAAVTALLDRQAIEANLACHALGLDRRDLELIRRSYAPNATVAYGLFEGQAADFAAMIVDFMRPMPPTQHRTSNVLIRRAGDTATSESYVVACMTLPDPGAPRQALIQGRYLDRHRRGADGWRLAHRAYVFDWHMERPLGTAAVPAPFAAGARAAPAPPFSHRPQETDMTLPPSLRTELDAALARHAIHDLIMLQARATDRGDEALLASLYRPGATVDVGFFAGPAAEYCPFIIEVTAAMQRMSHTIANEIIAVRGDEAVAESYVVAFTTAPNESGGADDGITAGRYLDRFARRDGVWKYTERRFVEDFALKQAAQAEAADGLTAQLTLRGRRSREDPLYDFWGR